MNDTARSFRDNLLRAESILNPYVELFGNGHTLLSNFITRNKLNLYDNIDYVKGDFENYIKYYKRIKYTTNSDGIDSILYNKKMHNVNITCINDNVLPSVGSSEIIVNTNTLLGEMSFIYPNKLVKWVKHANRKGFTISDSNGYIKECFAEGELGLIQESIDHLHKRKYRYSYDGEKMTRKETYDDMNRLIYSEDYTHDAIGNVITIKNNIGKRTEYQYKHNDGVLVSVKITN